jgi:hypothetical protein
MNYFSKFIFGEKLDGNEVLNHKQLQLQLGGRLQISLPLQSRNFKTGARICKRLLSPGIDSEESIPPAYVA